MIGARSQVAHRGLVGSVATIALLVSACTAGETISTAQTSTSTPSAVTATEVATTEASTTEAPTTEVATTEAPTTEAPLADPVTALAVSDLTDCRGPDGEVAALVRSLEGTVLMPGDLANREGSREQFDDCFLPLYGSELSRIFATPGDNDYNTPGASPYYAVMADRPGEPNKGWYATEIGAWQLISLNSNCDSVGGCREGSEQYQWLDELLDQGDYECRVAMWHEPRFTSSANYSGIPRLGDFYQRLHEAGTDIVLVGHSHHYERLGPLTPDGQPSPDGMMNFTLGVGGSTFTQFGEPLPGSQIRSNEHRGLVRFTLRDGGYDWEFVNVESNPFPLEDSGSGDC